MRSSFAGNPPRRASSMIQRIGYGIGFDMPSAIAMLTLLSVHPPRVVSDVAMTTSSGLANLTQFIVITAELPHPEARALYAAR
jgi:hypothetical protein